MHAIHSIFYSLHVFDRGTHISQFFLYLPQSKYKKIHYREISSIRLSVLEFFCVPLYTEFLSDLYEKFQVASVYDTNVKYQI